MNKLLEALIAGFVRHRKRLARVPLYDFRRAALDAYTERGDTSFEYALSKSVILALSLILVGAFMVVQSQASAVWVLAIFLSALPISIYVQFRDMEKITRDKRREIGRYFSKFSANCALLVEVGMNVRKSFVVCAQNAEESQIKPYLMKAASDIEMNAHSNEVYKMLTFQMNHTLVTEFTSVMLQIERYGTGSGKELLDITDSAWQKRRSDARVKASELDTLLVFPSMLVFSGIMIMLFAVMVMQFL